MIKILQGDALARLRELPAESVQCCVTSPPYWGLRDYGVVGQIGLEPTPAAYVEKMVAVFEEVRRVLRGDGVCWVNLGDSYGGDRTTGRNDTDRETPGGRGGSFRDSTRTKVAQLKPKDLVGIPWRVAFSLQAAGWWLRMDVIWSKPNPMPESVMDRPTKAHEYVFMLTKAARYYWDAEAVREAEKPWNAGWVRAPKMGAERIHGAGKAGTTEKQYETIKGANIRSVWTIPTQPYPEAHFATFPEALAQRCILAASKPGDTILDPFGGSGTVGKVAQDLGRRAVLIELNPAYCELAQQRCSGTPGMALV